jgi:hypothetical protein
MCLRLFGQLSVFCCFVPQIVVENHMTLQLFACPAALVSPTRTKCTFASTHRFSLSVMMPSPQRQPALKDMKDAEGASLIGKISSRFTGDLMALTT